MPFGEYKDWDDCISKNSDKGDPQAYCGYIKNKVEEALLRKEASEAIKKAVGEQDAQEPEGLTTPSAGDQGEDVTKDLTSPQGSSREAENPQASGRGELSPANPAQDQAEPSANPQDQAEPNNAGHQTATEDDENLDNRNEEDYKAPEDEFKDKKREDQQGLEYDGRTYHKVEALEYEGKIYVPKCVQCPKKANENDLEYEDKFYQEADEDVLELDNDYYVKDEEQAPLDTTGMAEPTTAISTPELNPIGESVIIKENGKYVKYNVFQAREQDENSVEEPAEVKDVTPTEAPQANLANKTIEPKVEPVEQKDASEEIRAVEKIIIKENGKLKFKSVFTEVKKKL